MTEMPGWDDYFLNIATVVATRAKCTRRQVGAVVVKDHRIVSTGYNGAPAGEPHCTDGACPRGALSVAECPPGTGYAATGCIAVHAEVNALLYADRDKCEGATIYVTSEPCDQCRPVICAAGIWFVVWPDGSEKFIPKFPVRHIRLASG